MRQVLKSVFERRSISEKNAGLCKTVRFLSPHGCCCNPFLLVMVNVHCCCCCLWKLRCFLFVCVIRSVCPWSVSVTREECHGGAGLSRGRLWWAHQTQEADQSGQELPQPSGPAQGAAHEPEEVRRQDTFSVFVSCYLNSVFYLIPDGHTWSFTACFWGRDSDL